MMFGFQTPMSEEPGGGRPMVLSIEQADAWALARPDADRGFAVRSGLARAGGTTPRQILCVVGESGFLGRRYRLRCGMGIVLPKDIRPVQGASLRGGTAFLLKTAAKQELGGHCGQGGEFTRLNLPGERWTAAQFG